MNSQSSLVPLRAGGSGCPLFLIPGVDGAIARLTRLTNHLRFGGPIYGIQSQALLRGTRVRTRVEDQAAFYLHEIRNVQPSGPYHIVGFSYGGLIALEIAQQLLSQNQHTALLGVVDTLRIGVPMALETKLAHHTVSKSKTWLGRHLSNTFRPGGLAYARRQLSGRALRSIYTILDKLGQPIPDIIRRPYDINWFAGVRYVPLPYSGPLTVLQSSTTAHDGIGAAKMWEQIARGSIEFCEIPGDHDSLLLEPTVALLAREIEARLARLK